MASDSAPAEETSRKDFDWGAETERLHQIRVALAMTPAERLRWLETTVAELRPWVGLARTAKRG
ncbi:MAG: hypothetical protein GY719_08175 [bacterium]|nr:hypothetical protein [bacterium]